MEIEPVDQWRIALTVGVILFFPTAMWWHLISGLDVVAQIAFGILGVIGFELMIISAFHIIRIGLGDRKKA